MNRRQKKKAYKKKHGFNPPKDKQYAIFLEKFMFPTQKMYREYVNRIAKNFTETIVRVLPVFAEAVKAAVNTAKEAIENIKTMPEEDFNRLLESPELDEEIKALARQIRRSGQNGLHTGNNAAERTGSERAYTERRTPDN